MKTSSERLSPAEQQVAAEFARLVRQRFGERVLDMRVFGSRARGQARPDSDLDIWILLDYAGSGERRDITDLATDLLLDGVSPFVISPRVMSREQYATLTRLERLLPRDIERDGIDL